MGCKLIFGRLIARFFFLGLFPALLSAQEGLAQEHLGVTIVTEADLFEANWPLDMTLRFDLKNVTHSNGVKSFQPLLMKVTLLG